ncbi:MAG: hypothetical protein ACTHMM_18405 [Agriterribacter sp.]
MGGIARICKLYGKMTTTDEKGNKIEWVWDYHNDKPRRKEEMTKEDFKLSEKAKSEQIQSTITNKTE